MIDAPARPDLDWAMDQLGIEWQGGGIDLAGDPQSVRLRAAIAARLSSIPEPQSGFRCPRPARRPGG